ncbi:hypothetical protein BX600DRAFT_437576 [Xylariales sp. PMI_506]|nr:hypothetical protein BX600DRAFT_437576 [Xylariales sp. PMI_506]
MKCTGLGAATLLSFLVIGATAGDFIDEIRADFHMGLFPRQASTIQVFTGVLGTATAAPISASTDPARPFEVGGDTFPDFATAAGRVCDNQMNACADQANSQNQDPFSVSDCTTQQTQCESAIKTATVTSFSTITSSNADFDFICEE